MSAIQFSAVSVVAGRRTILGPLDLVVQEHGWTSIVGRSGSGKTTLLRVVAGLAGADGAVAAPTAAPVAEGSVASASSNTCAPSPRATRSSSFIALLTFLPALCATS